MLALERISLDDYGQALRRRDAEGLTTAAYPVERPFEIIDNYAIELSRLGLELAGLDSGGSGPAILARLRIAGVISAARCERLTRIHAQRNELQHEYPDARAALVYEAAQLQVAEMPGFFRDYAAWMRKLGFGFQS